MKIPRPGIIILAVLILGALWLGREQLFFTVARPTHSPLTSELSELPTSPAPEVVKDNLQVPWALGWLLDGTLLVTERPGRLVAIFADQSTKVIPIAATASTGEGGLLGLAIHPHFADNSFLYLYLTSEVSTSGVINRVERYRWDNGELKDRLVIIDAIPGSRVHDGGRLAFGPDEKLYITTGDAGNENNAQDKDSLAGKILRVNDDGSTPSDNPLATPVYSYGHRNPQGLTWDEEGRLWATEHGRSGVQSGFDELNLIEPGHNYGWPVIEGDKAALGMKQPIIHSGATTTWAPAGAVFFQGSIFFGGLRGEALYQAILDGSEVKEIRQHFTSKLGRIREVTLGPDDQLYLTTSNTDGRGQLQPDDDKIIRLDPQIFFSP